eukprot:1857271-Lingulodinium_polyedra.AAC.1
MRFAAFREVAPRDLHFPAVVEVVLAVVVLGAVDAAAEDGPRFCHLLRLLPVRHSRSCEQRSWLPFGKLLAARVELAEQNMLSWYRAAAQMGQVRSAWG